MSLELIIGCMFAGKTTELVKRIKSAKSLGKRVLTVCHTLDGSRYSKDAITTHDKDFIPAIPMSDLSSLTSCLMSHYDVICIDEGQFFKDIFTAVFDLVNVFDKHVIVCGLDGDFMARPFIEILRLIPIADSVVKLSAKCSVEGCGQVANFSRRIAYPLDQENKDSNNVIRVGGADMYQAVCRKHFLTNQL